MAAGARIIGISFDTSADNKVFAGAQEFGFPLLSDVDHSVGQAYGVERGPDEQYPDYPKRMTFLIDRDGIVAKVYEVTDVGAHTGEVLDDIVARRVAARAGRSGSGRGVAPI